MVETDLCGSGTVGGPLILRYRQEQKTDENGNVSNLLRSGF